MNKTRTFVLAACALICAHGPTSAQQKSITARPTPQRFASGALADDAQNLIRQLQSPMPAERAAAACALGRMEARANDAVPALVNLLSDGARVAKTCGNQPPFEDEEWQPDYETVKETTVGEAATHALMAIGPASLDALIDNLTTNASWRARKNAAWALAHRGNERAMRQMLVALRDEAWQVRAEAAYALFQRGGASEETVNALIAATRDEAWQARREAASALGHKSGGAVDIVEPLLGLLRQDEDPRVRAEAAGALLHSADGRAFPVLLEALKDEDAGIRNSVAETLGHRAGNDEVPLLIAALKDANPKVRAGAKQALKIVKIRSQGTQTYLRPLPPGIP
jgi:HEAT repeat protein